MSCRVPDAFMHEGSPLSLRLTEPIASESGATVRRASVSLAALQWTVSAVTGSVPAGIDLGNIPATVPGCVHTDLLAAGLIADPFDGANEADIQWIGRTTWRYDTEFTWPDSGATRHDLVAAGLDTFATIELNDRIIGRTQNQHRSYRFDIREVLREGTNRLSVTFEAPVDVAEARSAEHGELPHTNHHPYNAVRKMASNFGWDWGIDVATSGIWKSLSIESWSGVRIAAVRPLVDVDGTSGILTAHVEIERDGVGTSAAVGVTAAVGGVLARAHIDEDQTATSVVVRVPEVHLWWPVGHGEHPLYDARVTAESDAGADDWSGRIGFRTIELNASADEAGTPFILQVNGRPVQVRGANWIPDHAFLTQIDRDRYARRVTDAVEANMNLLRVWGGGIYEDDDFYTECDERGVLVWQDFLFACAAYAEEEWLAVEVEAEAREAITRLSAHPSLAIWNGNNENIWGYVEWGWRPRLGDRTWGNGYYRELLPALIAELDPTRPYSPASPYSFSEYMHPNDQANGTMHVWDVWNTRDYSVYRDYTPRFVSEFGFQGPPAWSTLTRVVHDEPLDPYGAQMLFHQKAHDGNLKLERGMIGHLPAPRTIEDWHWSTQLNQAQALRFGIEHFRSLAPHNTGTIVWQLNDNWPVVSWAAVDFDEHRKPLWYALRDAYRPRLATIQPRDDGLALVLLNDTNDDWSGRIRVSRRSFDGAILDELTFDASVSARGATTVRIEDRVAETANASREIVVAEPVDDDSGFERAIWNYAEVVDQELDPAAIDVNTTAVDGGYAVQVVARSYVRDVFLQVDRVDRDATVRDGMVTMLAGERTVIRIDSGRVHEPALYASTEVVRTANDLLAEQS
jgi:beta-mannosidase